MAVDRSVLPFRETSDAFLVYEGKILAFNKGKYFQFPGGGIDEGETPEKAVRREIKEETGCTVVALKRISVVDSIWFPSWADTEKRKARYAQFQGERTYLFVGIIKSMGTPTSNEGDAWPMPIKQHLVHPAKLLKTMEKIEPVPDPNFYCYRKLQMAIISMINYCDTYIF